MKNQKPSSHAWPAAITCSMHISKIDELAHPLKTMCTKQKNKSLGIPPVH